MRPNTNFPIKRLEIIKIALDLFLEKGYDQTKISHIMKAANLSKGGMYHYFDSKESILDAVIEYALAEEMSDFDNQLITATTTFDKMKIFLGKANLDYSDYLKKFTQFKRTPESSIVTYRIKEITANIAIPYLQAILEFGIKEDVFQTDFPDELARVLYQAGEDLFYDVARLNEHEIGESSSQIQRKIEAFSQLLTRSLVLTPENATYFQQLLRELLIPNNSKN